MLKHAFKRIVIVLITTLAKLVIERYHPQVIAITGSVGKTTSKDAIFSALSSKGFVRKSEKSFNSEIGVPLSILGRPNAWSNPVSWLANIFSGLSLLIGKHPYPEKLVLEIGADRPGDIRSVAHWLKPDVVVVTRIPEVPVHVEFFESPDDVVKEKAELVKVLKEGGVLALNADDERVLALARLAPKGARVVAFGFSRGADVSASKIGVRYEGRGEKRHPVGVRFMVRTGEQNGEMKIAGTVGKQSVSAALSGIAVASALGYSFESINQGLSGFSAPPGRMRLIEGVKHSMIIDDTYNSSPVAVRNALDTLKEVTTKGRTIAVLGDMLELGRFSVQEHKSIGVYAKECVDTLVVIGVRSKDSALEALSAGMDSSNVLQFEDASSAGRALEQIIKPNDVILVKGSQGMRMERIVERIMAHPEERGRLLARQETEWRERQ